jgi:iron complex outermembrane receptor protein
MTHNPRGSSYVWHRARPWLSGGLAMGAAILGNTSPAGAQSMDYSSLEQLFREPVTTSATGTPQRASEVSADITIVTAEQIRQSGSRNIPEILGMYVPGLNVLQEGIDAFDIGIRGYQQSYQPRLLVLVDGRQVFNDDYSRMSWDNMAVNVDDIRQIEVVEGAASALFGSNAAGGVVNIITYSPAYDHSNTASLGTGTQSSFHADGTATFAIGDFGGMKISAGGLSEKEFNTARTPGDSTVGTVNPSHRYVAQSSEFKINNDLSVMTEATYAEKNNQEAVFISAIDPVKATSYSLRAGFVWQTPFGMIKNDNYINHNNTDLDAGVRGEIQVINQLIVSRVEDLFKLGTDHTFRFFAEYRDKRQNDQGFPVLVYEHPQFDSDVYSAGGTWLWQINDKWSWTNAFRVDHITTHLGGLIEAAAIYSPSDYARAYDTISANSGLVYRMNSGDTLRALYGRGVSDPSLVENGFDLAIVTGPNSVLDYEGNPFLKPAIVENYGLDYEHAFAEIFSTLKLSTYYERNTNLAAYITGAPRVVGGIVYVLKTAQNIGNSDGLGGEIDLNGTHGGFRWDASYSYQSIHDTPLVVQKLDYANSAPKHQFRLNLGYTNDKWEADLHGQYVTSTDMLRFTTVLMPIYTGAYYNLGGRLGYKLTDKITVSLSGTGLTSGITNQSAYPAVERRLMLNVTGNF